jgi:hypothetical protein
LKELTDIVGLHEHVDNKKLLICGQLQAVLRMEHVSSWNYKHKNLRTPLEKPAAS